MPKQRPQLPKALTAIHISSLMVFFRDTSKKNEGSWKVQEGIVFKPCNFLQCNLRCIPWLRAFCWKRWAKHGRRLFQGDGSVGGSL